MWMGSEPQSLSQSSHFIVRLRALGPERVSAVIPKGLHTVSVRVSSHSVTGYALVQNPENGSYIFP